MKSLDDQLLSISTAFGEYYSRTFAAHGATAQGVDWGVHLEDTALHYKNMLNILAHARSDTRATRSILDVGCGYGGLLDYAKDQSIILDYHGIDLCLPMIEAARARHPDAEFRCGDVFSTDMNSQFDYVICNGVLTLKLSTSTLIMNAYAQALIRRIFDLCRVGAAFNVMSSFVNFTAPHLYYRNPSELLAWCMSELTTRVRLDHSYPLYQYTIYLYREDAEGIEMGSHRIVER